MRVTSLGPDDALRLRPWRSEGYAKFRQCPLAEFEARGARATGRPLSRPPAGSPPAQASRPTYSSHPRRVPSRKRESPRRPLRRRTSAKLTIPFDARVPRRTMSANSERISRRHVTEVRDGVGADRGLAVALGAGLEVGRFAAADLIRAGIETAAAR